MKKNYFKTILIAIAILTGFSVTTMAQTQTTIAKMGASTIFPKVKANWTGDGYIKVNGVILTKGELKEITTTERGSMTGIPTNFRGIEVYAVGNVKLTHLYMSECYLGYVDVSKCTDLEFLDLYKNNITSLDVSACKEMRNLYCNDNALTTLNIKGCNYLTDMVASGQNINVSIKDGKYINPISYTPKSGVENIKIDGINYAKDSPLQGPAAGNTLKFTTGNTASGPYPNNVFSGTITLVGYTPPIPVDKTPPKLPDNRTLTISNITSKGFDVTWHKATDETTDQKDLKYRVYAIDAYTDVIDEEVTMTDINTFTFTKLNVSEYFCVVQVIDLAGNMSQYTSSFVETIAASIPVTGIAISQAEMSLEVGQMVKLTESITPGNATNKSVTWSSSNAIVATVSTTGEVTANAAGSTIISVTSAENGSLYASCLVTVTPAAPISIPVSGITVSPTALSLDVGKTGNLFVSITPSTATNKDVTWKSSNDAIATVNASGQVTAKAEGTAVIAVTTVDGGHLALCNVTVNSPVDNGTIAGNTFAAYPNPTDGELTIEGVAPGGIVRLYSVTGSLIASYTAHEGVLKIDLSSLKQGLYLINYEGKTMKVIRK